jgi:hypothetical protein
MKMNRRTVKVILVILIALIAVLSTLMNADDKCIFEYMSDRRSTDIIEFELTKDPDTLRKIFKAPCLEKDTSVLQELRSEYLLEQIRLDKYFIALYGSLFVVLLLLFTERWGVLRMSGIAWIICIMIFDLLENRMIGKIASVAPDAITAAMAEGMYFWALLKWTMLFILAPILSWIAGKETRGVRLVLVIMSTVTIVLFVRDPGLWYGPLTATMWACSCFLINLIYVLVILIIQAIRKTVG